MNHHSNTVKGGLHFFLSRFTLLNHIFIKLLITQYITSVLLETFFFFFALHKIQELHKVYCRAQALVGVFFFFKFEL